MVQPIDPRSEIGTLAGDHRRGIHATPMDPDLELLKRWRDGVRAAGDELLARYFNMWRVYFVARVPERQTEDLIQEVFLRMVEAHDRFEGRSSVRTFLTSIARNVFNETVRE